VPILAKAEPLRINTLSESSSIGGNAPAQFAGDGGVLPGGGADEQLQQFSRQADWDH